MDWRRRQANCVPHYRRSVSICLAHECNAIGHARSIFFYDAPRNSSHIQTEGMGRYYVCHVDASTWFIVENVRKFFCPNVNRRRFWRAVAATTASNKFQKKNMLRWFTNGYLNRMYKYTKEDIIAHNRTPANWSCSAKWRNKLFSLAIQKPEKTIRFLLCYLIPTNGEKKLGEKFLLQDEYDVRNSSGHQLITLTHAARFFQWK